MSCVSQIILKDSNGQLWSVQMSDVGVSVIAKVSSGIPETRVLTDFNGSSTSWLVGITTLGVLTTSRVPFLQSYPAAIQFDTTPSAFPYQLLVSNTGNLQSFGPIQPNEAVGKLLSWPAENPYEYGHFSQPGGPGHPVFPTQTPEEHNGRFMPGCGHSINGYNLVLWQILPCVQTFLITCPVCSWIQGTITPQEFYANGDPLIA